MSQNRKRRGRGEHSVYQRPNGRWAGVVSRGLLAGARKRNAVYGASKAEVLEKLHALQNGLAGGVEPGRLTLEGYLQRWLSTMAQKVAPNTYRRYEQHVRLHIVPILGAVQLSRLSALDIESFYVEMTRKGASSAEQFKCGTVLRMALKHAVGLRLIQHNHAGDVPRPKHTAATMHVLDLDQVAVFLDAAKSDPLYAMYVLALDSGARQGELYGLQWGDVDWRSNSILVQRSLEEISGKQTLKEVKTNKGRRRIDLSAVTMAALNQHRKKMLAAGRVSGPVFCNEDGGYLYKSTVRRWSFLPLLARTNEALAKAGLPLLPEHAKANDGKTDSAPAFRFHDLRHSVATLLLLAGENPKVVSERLGHAKVEITLNTYSHVLPTLQKGAAEKMNRILGQPAPTPKIG